MAHLYKRRRQFWICYYVNGQRVQKSLKTDNERIARDKKRKIEYELSLGDFHITSRLLLPVVLEDFSKYRPIFHKCDATIRGHVFCSFLALLLRKELENHLEQKGLTVEWADVTSDLDNLVEMEIEVSSDKRYTIRSHTAGTVAKVFGACGVALPPMLSQC